MLLSIDLKGHWWCMEPLLWLTLFSFSYSYSWTRLVYKVQILYLLW